MQNVRLQDVALEALGSYHPLWLRLGLEVVLGCHVRIHAQGGAKLQQQCRAMQSFLVEHFLADQLLRSLHTYNQTQQGWQTQTYWVSRSFMMFVCTAAAC